MKGKNVSNAIDVFKDESDQIQIVPTAHSEKILLVSKVGSSTTSGFLTGDECPGDEVWIIQKLARMIIEQKTKLDQFEKQAAHLVKYRSSLSYNDSYFGEPVGFFKHVVAELDRLCTQTPVLASKENDA